VVVADLPGSGAFVPLLGVPMVVHAVRGLLASGVVEHVVLLVRPDAGNTAARLVSGLPVSVHAGPRDRAAAVVERSGRTVVLLHDVARPLAPPALALAVTEAVAAGHGVAVPVLPLSDTVKHVDDADLIVDTPDRTGLRVVQTPQSFRLDLLGSDVLHRMLTSEAPVEQSWALADELTVTVPGHPLAFPVRSTWERELAEVLGSGVLA
jgi:2-C-methyl-D-erythritol 4-phosphate cytidylyltransferase